MDFIPTSRTTLLSILHDIDTLRDRVHGLCYQPRNVQTDWPMSGTAGIGLSSFGPGAGYAGGSVRTASADGNPYPVHQHPHPLPLSSFSSPSRGRSSKRKGRLTKCGKANAGFSETNEALLPRSPSVDDRSPSRPPKPPQGWQPPSPQYHARRPMGGAWSPPVSQGAHGTQRVARNPPERRPKRDRGGRGKKRDRPLRTVGEEDDQEHSEKGESEVSEVSEESHEGGRERRP